MLSAQVIESLPDLPTPVLTVYLNTSLPQPAGTTSAPLKPPYLLQLESQVKKIAGTVPAEDREAFETQAKRVEAYLASHPLPYRGIIIFAGPEVWEVLPVQTETQDEVGWGIPVLAQLFWLLDEHRPYGVVLAGRKGARFFLSRLGGMVELEGIEFHPEESRRKEMGPVSRPGVRMSRGTNRDVFAHHRDAQFQLLHREIAARIEHLRAAERLDSIVLAGLSDVTRSIQKELPEALRNDVVLVEEDLGFMSQAEIQERVVPLVASHERARENKMVEELLEKSRGVAKGVDETLAQLQQGRVRRIIAATGLGGDVRQCTRCGRVDREADATCSVCNGERQTVGLRAILPLLVRRQRVSMEVVSGEAAQKLRETGGVCAWLREFEPKEYSSSASTGR